MFIYSILKNVYCILLITASLYNKGADLLCGGWKNGFRRNAFTGFKPGHGINQRQNLLGESSPETAFAPGTVVTVDISYMD